MRREEGSVLVEALIAAAIVAMVLVAVFQIAADSAARRHGVETRRHALLIAQSQLAAVGSTVPLAPGAVQGRDGDEVWRIDMQPCNAGQGASAAGRLFCVDVSVRPAEGGAPWASLSSRRLAPLT
jgi:type II secretory pathway pseudopilin PulG